MTIDLSEISLQLAGQVGTAGLADSAGVPGLLAAVDQHGADLRDALAGPTAPMLLAYARGFVEAAVGRGWQPRPGDWESVRLAAVCQLLTRAREPAAGPA